MSYEIVEKLKKAIASHEADTREEAIGRVIEVGDGVARVSGLKNTKSQEMLAIETPFGELPALALSLEEEMIGTLILGEEKGVNAGAIVKNTGKVLSIEVCDEILGRVIDPLGRPLDGLGPIVPKGKTGVRYPL